MGEVLNMVDILMYFHWIYKYATEGVQLQTRGPKFYHLQSHTLEIKGFQLRPPLDPQMYCLYKTLYPKLKTFC